MMVVVFLFEHGSHMSLNMPKDDALALVEAWAAWKRGQADFPAIQGGVGWAFISEEVIGAYTYEPDPSLHKRQVEAAEKMMALMEKDVGKGEEWKG
mgnify:CR=1 FL=1